MPSWKDSFPSKWLKASDFEEPKLLTIRKHSSEKFQDGTHGLVVWFVELPKGLIVNKTNAKSISKIAGSDDMDRWIKARVVLFKTETELGGETVDCIRIRAPKPGAKLPPPPPPAEEPVESEENLRDDFVPSDDDVPF